ncbi:MAG TPA: peptidoglycan-binding protein, partial [Polyangiales bacterium]|nr:peptidoglycan-binding protein [Polyangiales bacterium]
MSSSRLKPKRVFARSLRASAAAAGLLFAGACAAPQDSAPAAQAGEVEPAPVIEGLRLGDHGPEVRFVHDHLLNYGYFPNDALAAANPGWRALMDEVPADPDDFDDILEQGVRGYQAFNGLRVSGVVDAETLARMKSQRCGVPDSFPREEDKIAHNSQFLGESDCAVTTTSTTKTITFRVEETDATRAAAFRSALTEWSRLSSMRFREVTSGGCMIFKRGRQMLASDRANPTDDPIAVNHVTFSTSSNRIKRAEITVGTRKIDGSVIPYASGTPNGSQFSLRVSVLHEIGHTFGLTHSAHLAANGINRDILDAPIMAAAQATADTSTLLTDDDVHSLHFKIGVQRNDSLINGRTSKSFDVSRGGDFWEIDNTSSASNGSPIRCNGTTVFGAGSHIAVDNSRAWHTIAFGEVFKNRFVGCGQVQWDRIEAPVPLGYIAANGNGGAGEVWALGRDVAR